MCPRILSKSLESHRRLVGAGRLAKCVPRASPAHTRQVKRKIGKKRGAKGWAGRWRAFIRWKTLGTTGKPDLRALGEQYREVVQKGGEDLKHVERMSKAAAQTALEQPPQAGRSAFGPKARCTQRKQLKDMRLAMSSALKDDDKEQGILNLGKRLLMLGTDLKDCLSVARAAMRAQTREENKHREQVLQVLQEFDEGLGKQQLDELRMAIPDLPIESLKAFPSPQGVSFEFAPKSEDISGASAWAYSSKDSNCSAALREYWQQVHQLVSEGPSAGSSEVPDDRTECRKAGRCLCSRAGQDLKTLRNTFLREMKKVFPPKTDRRKALLNAEIVCRLEASPDMEDFDALLELDNPVRVVYLHLGKMSLSPYRPTFMLLDRGDAGYELGSAAPRTHVKASRDTDTHGGAPDDMIVLFASACLRAMVFPAEHSMSHGCTMKFSAYASIRGAKVAFSTTDHP